MGCYLALDQGTTSSRAIVFDDAGAVLGAAQHEFAQHFPEPGHVEHDAEEILATQWRAAVDACAAAGEPAIAAAGITNQRETVVVFERATGEPIHRAIVWQDRRTAERLAELRAAGHEDEVLRRTGLPLDPYFSAAKIAHVLDAVPGARERADRGELGAATIDAWLLYRLTGGEVFATEPSNASRTALFDLAAGDWSDELCAIFGVPRACLPEVRPSAGAFGDVREGGKGWPIRAMLGDQQSALFGQGCFAAGDSKCTYGTGAFLLANAGHAPPAPGGGVLATVAWRLGDELTYAREGAALVSGAVVQWLRDGLGVIEHAADTEPLARSVEDSGGVVLVPAFAGLGTPHWDPHARGLLIGITRGTTRGHVARAALEAMALQVCDLGAAFAACGTPLGGALRVDGGATANRLLLEVQATLLGRPVRRPAQLETTALGAARMAMIGSGACARPEDLPALAGDALVVEPGAGAGDPARLLRLWAEAQRRAKGWASV